MIYSNLKQLNQHLANKGRLMALDVGTKTIGVAISDGDWLIANPRLTIGRVGNKKDFLLIKKIIEENKIVATIIGLPLNMDESESKMSEFVRRFANNLDEFLIDKKIAFCDERLSSFAAAEIIHNGRAKNYQYEQLIDQIAASVILKDALDELNKK
jgi:putative Holliday junction resolvase